MGDLISREKLKDDIAVLLERNDKLIDEWLANCIDDVIDEQPTVDAESLITQHEDIGYERGCRDGYAEALEVTVDAEPVDKWIPVTERLPDEGTAVNITWVNHNPVSYYQYIKDKPQTATGVYYCGKWYWWSAVVQDYLAEYGEWEPHKMDVAIEVTHWMPLPKPYRGGGIDDADE